MTADTCKHTFIHTHTLHTQVDTLNAIKARHVLVLVNMTFNFIDAFRCLNILIIRQMPPDMHTHAHTTTTTEMHTASSCEMTFGSGTCQKVTMYSMSHGPLHKHRTNN